MGTGMKKRPTLPAFIAPGARRDIDGDRAEASFVLRDASVGGTGLQSEFANATWEQLRNAGYENHGA